MDCYSHSTMAIMSSHTSWQVLGFYIGPAAGSMIWDGPIGKYNNRILEMKRDRDSIALNCLTYNTRIAPVTSYVAQTSASTQVLPRKIWNVQCH